MVFILTLENTVIVCGWALGLHWQRTAAMTDAFARMLSYNESTAAAQIADLTKAQKAELDEDGDYFEDGCDAAIDQSADLFVARPCSAANQGSDDEFFDSAPEVQETSQYGHEAVNSPASPTTEEKEAFLIAQAWRKQRKVLYPIGHERSESSSSPDTPVVNSKLVLQGVGEAGDSESEKEDQGDDEDAYGNMEDVLDELRTSGSFGSSQGNAVLDRMLWCCCNSNQLFI
jgi:hypothetical protein